VPSARSIQPPILNGCQFVTYDQHNVVRGQRSVLIVTLLQFSLEGASHIQSGRIRRRLYGMDALHRLDGNDALLCFDSAKRRLSDFAEKRPAGVRKPHRFTEGTESFKPESRHTL